MFIFLINWFDFSRLKFKTNCILLWKHKRFHRIRFFDRRMSFIEKKMKKKKACCFSSPGLCNLLYNLNGLMMHIIYLEITICIYICKIFIWGHLRVHIWEMRMSCLYWKKDEAWKFTFQTVCLLYLYILYICISHIKS